jgi:hypothetical protein
VYELKINVYSTWIICLWVKQASGSAAS